MQRIKSPVSRAFVVAFVALVAASLVLTLAAAPADARGRPTYENVYSVYHRLSDEGPVNFDVEGPGDFGVNGPVNFGPGSPVDEVVPEARPASGRPTA